MPKRVAAEPSAASQEFDTGYAEMMEISSHQALLNFYQRHDQRIEKTCANSREQRACAEGCSYCCNFKVVADALEIFAMVEYAEKSFDPQRLEQVVSTAQKNIEEARDLDHQQQSTINQRCPMLNDHACSMYPVRPIKCRNFHSTDVSSCKASYDNPTDLTILNDNIPALYIAATGSTNGFMSALHNHDFDDRIYDMNAGFIEALKDPACRQRYDAGKRAFKTAKYNNE